MSVYLNPHFNAHIGAVKELVDTPPMAGTLLLGPVAGMPPRMLQWVESAPNTRVFALMSGLPPKADLDRAAALGIRLGIYLPNEKRLVREPLLAIGEYDNSKSVALLYKYAQVGQRPFILGDSNAIADAALYVKLIRPYTDTLLLLGEETHAARARAIYAVWHNLSA